MNILKELYLIPVYLYKGIISPFTAPSCRYEPSCSTYFLEAVKKFGILRGTILGVVRIARCRKSFFGGPDPIPEEFSFKRIKIDWEARKKPKDFDKNFKESMNREK